MENLRIYYIIHRLESGHASIRARKGGKSAASTRIHERVSEDDMVEVRV